MKYNEAIFKKKFNRTDRSGTGLHNFIVHYLNEYKYELVKKLGFNLGKFNARGGELFISSIEIDFNYPIQPKRDLIIKVEFLDIQGSRVRIRSFIRNINGGLVATAISTIIIVGADQNSSHFDISKYFKIVEIVEEFAN